MKDEQRAPGTRGQLSRGYPTRAPGTLGSLALSGLLAFGGCTSTDRLSGVALQTQLRPEHRQHVVLRSTEDWAVRIDPNTELQLWLRTGELTDWISASKLWTSELGLSYETIEGSVFIPWSEIAGASARNLSGLKTAGAIVLVAGAVALVVAMVFAKSGGSSGGIGRSSSASPSRGPAATPHLAPARIAPRGGHRMHLGLGPLPPAPVLLIPVTPPPGPEEVSVHPGPEPLPPSAYPAPTPPAAPRPAPQVTRPASPLFDARAQRRASIRVTASGEGGAELSRSARGTGAAFLGLRLLESIELAGGFRHFSRSIAGASEIVSSYVGVGRVGAHLTLDAWRRLARALGVVAGGGGNVDFHLRLQWGLRVSLFENLSLGLFPFNGCFAYYGERSPTPGAKVWSFPSTLELGLNY